jgi:hypothetical protein
LHYKDDFFGGSGLESLTYLTQPPGVHHFKGGTIFFKIRYGTSWSLYMPLGGIWAVVWKKPKTKPKNLRKRARHSATKWATHYISGWDKKVLRRFGLSSYWEYWGGKTSWRCCVRRLTRCSCGQSSKMCLSSWTMCQSHLSQILSS